MSEFETSKEERLQIAQHFLLSSPPGQFHEVLGDVRKLLKDGILTEALETGIARVYNCKNGKVVTAPSGAKVALSTAGEVDATHYVDSTNGAVFAIDHLTLTTSEDPLASNQDGSLELQRAALQSSVSQYVSRQYSSEHSAGSVYAKGGQLIVSITGEKPNLRNFWSGKWNSFWTLAISGDSCTISGDIKVHAHYFEDGNVQLQTNKPVAAAQIAVGGEKEFAEAVVAHIKAAESTLQSALGDMYANMNEETFRCMRRVLPVTRTKMEWNVNAVRMVGQLQGGGGSSKAK